MISSLPCCRSFTCVDQDAGHCLEVHISPASGPHLPLQRSLGNLPAPTQAVLCRTCMVTGPLQLFMSVVPLACSSQVSSHELLPTSGPSLLSLSCYCHFSVPGPHFCGFSYQAGREVSLADPVDRKWLCVDSRAVSQSGLCGQGTCSGLASRGAIALPIPPSVACMVHPALFCWPQPSTGSGGKGTAPTSLWSHMAGREVSSAEDM